MRFLLYGALSVLSIANQTRATTITLSQGAEAYQSVNGGEIVDGQSAVGGSAEFWTVWDFQLQPGMPRVTAATFEVPVGVSTVDSQITFYPVVLQADPGVLLGPWHATDKYPMQYGPGTVENVGPGTSGTFSISLSSGAINFINQDEFLMTPQGGNFGPMWFGFVAEGGPDITMPSDLNGSLPASLTLTAPEPSAIFLLLVGLFSAWRTMG